VNKPIFISQPNKCDGCPVESMFTSGVPVGFKIVNACHRVQEDYDVTYHLNDFGKTICVVYRRIRDEA
jgi:hypothetical protein